MFGPMGGAYQRYQQDKDANEHAEHVIVTRKEFIELMVANGKTLASAEFHANLAEGFGSRVLIGGRKVSIGVEEKDVD